MDNARQIILTTVYNRRVAVYLDERQPVRLRAIEQGASYPIGTIVMARVKKKLDSSGACFVDIGDDTDYFLQIPAHVSDLVFADARDHKKVSCEDHILVQVSSEAVKMKSPCVTGKVSLNSAHFVIEAGKGLSFSSKLSPDERKNIKLPENIITSALKYHIIVRTECRETDDIEALADEFEILAASYERIMNRSRTAMAGNVLYKPPGLVEATVGDWIKHGCDEIVSDIPEYYEALAHIADARSVSFRPYEDEYPLCKLYKLETCIDTVLSRKVYLDSGAFLVIEQGETLTAIDVNSGHRIKGDKEETSYNINLDACDEILRQLRLRNISGMILIDFINLKSREHTDELIRRMSKLLKSDDVMCRYVDMTGLGLMEITRKRVMKSFAEQWKALN